MQAAVARRYGPPSVVEIADVPRPTPGPKDVLAPGGRLLLVVASLGAMIAAMVWPSRGGRKVSSGMAHVRGTDVEFLKRLVETGAFKPVIDRTYPWNASSMPMRMLTRDASAATW